MQYNTQLKTMVLPEYGRNVQSMVDHALTIEDREERKRCAQSIINTMGNLFPHLRDVEDFKHKLWDHLAIMSDFKLDIDYPYEIIRKENLFTLPDKVPYYYPRIKYRHYGHIVQNLINKAREMQPGLERDHLLSMIGNHMKRAFHTMNKEGEMDDNKIIKDIAEYTNGEIIITPEILRLRSSKEQPPRKNKNPMKRAVR